MVFYFTSSVVAPPAIIYMGEDKFENENLIRWGWPEDIWFHVDKLSSAHVYLRMRKGETIDDIPDELLTDCCQLVKANSIEGCKMNNIDIVYTPWANLKKTGDMVVGQIGYHKDKDVRKMTVEKKINAVVNRLNKTKVKKTPDFQAEREARDQREREAQRRLQKEQKELEKKQAKEHEEMEKLKSFSSLMKKENMKTNTDGYDSDDFM